jgi:hypothetical protein
LNLNSVSDFLKGLIVTLNIRKDIEVRIMGLPSFRSKIFGINKKGKILDEQLHGRSWKNKPLIDVFPDRLFPDKLSTPLLSVGLRGFILNSSVRAIIHEMLHKSGLNDETRVRELTEYYYKDFRRKQIQAFNDELKPLLKEWKECYSCHRRTERRFPKLRSYPSQSEEKIMLRGLGVMTKSQFLRLRGHKDEAVAEHDWITYQNEMRQQLRTLERLFHIDKFPLDSKNPEFCLKFRMKLKKRYVDGDTSAIDAVEINAHYGCHGCRDYFVALKRGELEGMLPEEREFIKAVKD